MLTLNEKGGSKGGSSVRITVDAPYTVQYCCDKHETTTRDNINDELHLVNP